MDNLEQNKANNNQSSPEEQIRIRKNFLEELESLRKEKEGILKKLGLRIRHIVSSETNNQDQEISLDEYLVAFLEELDDAEAEINRQKGVFNQATLNQGSSRLRILREKARTLLNNTKTDSSETDSQGTKII
ncbi:MAG: hypothetical protein U9Q72_02505 [Patescibacteria group bacterium]|nr:hypothetical protein [Patescibacteria group bacterium]